MPSYIHTATVTRGGVNSETIIIPCENWSMVCPVMGYMPVDGLDELFTQ